MASINEWHNLSQHYGRDWASDDHYVAIDFKHRRPISSNSFAYQMLLSEALGMKNTKVLAFKNNSSVPFAPSVHLSFQQYFAAFDPSKPRRYIPHSPEMTLDDNDILDDHYLNLLDWGSSNVLSIALGNTVYLRDESNDYVSEFVTVDDENGPVTSIKWAPDGQWIAVGLNNSDVQLWDTSSGELVRTLNVGHQSWVGSLDWNNNSILTTGGMDGEIINNDVRKRSHMVMAFKGHREQVCGLKWSASGQRLASGGNDNLIHIWDISKASSNAQRQWLHRFEDHTAAVRALAWCPFKRNLLASGGGEGDHNIKFWNTQTGACLNSFNTGSEVCALLWNKHERELLSAHSSDQNKLTLWKYPLMLKMADLTGHTSRVLFMAQSPNGCSVASAGGDGKLKIWNVFGTPEVAKPAPKANTMPFAHWNHIR